MLIALLLALPLRRFVPARRGLGGALALVATVTYLYFSNSAVALSVFGLALGIAGLALLMGGRASAQ